MNTATLDTMAFDNFEVADTTTLSESEGGGLLLAGLGAVTGFFGGGVVGCAVGTVTLPIVGTVAGATAGAVGGAGAGFIAGAAVDTWGPWI